MHVPYRVSASHIILILVACVVFGAAIPRTTQAASLIFSPSSGSVKINQNIIVRVAIDSGGQTINGVQATIVFPDDKLGVVSITKETSTFNFWLEEPVTTKGRIKFITGASAPASGSAIPVLLIMFTAKGVGYPILGFEDAAVTASDGAGTNILTTIGSALLTVLPEFATLPEATTTPVQPPASTTPALTPPPPIVRQPTPAKNLPKKPNLTIELYPDENSWYNISSPFLVRWELPPDISAIATALNRDVRFVPLVSSKDLTEGELKETLKDGVWYFHARFKNNIGWGETVHYRIAIDTASPAPFAIDALDGLATDNPAPRFMFRASDALSGINRYAVKIDGSESVFTENQEYTVPIQRPGSHTLVVKAFDRAGNAREESIGFETIPIPSPVILFITPFITTDNAEGFVLKGQARDAETIHAKFENRRGEAVLETSAQASGNGDWAVNLPRALPKGEYSVTVWAEDARGAQSIMVPAGAVVVRVKPLITIGFVELTVGNLAFIAAILAALGGYWFWRMRKLRALRYGLVEYDFYKMIDLMGRQIEEFEQRISGDMDPSLFRQESSHWVKNFRETLEKTKHYLVKEVERLKK